MIPFGNSKLTSQKDYEDIKSRLIWQIENRKSLIFPKANSFDADTNKPLVGKIDNELIVTRVRPFYINFFPQVFARIEIDNTLTERRIYFKYHLGLWSSLCFILLLLQPVIFFLLNSGDELNSVIDSFIFLLLFPVLASITAALEANKLKEKLIEIIED